MPHKRAKRTVREQDRRQKGSDLPPTLNSLRNEAIPKSAARVLNAAKVQQEFKLKKRKKEDDVGVGTGKRRKISRDGASDAKSVERVDRDRSLLSKMKIKPGESIQHFNRRVEDDMRPLVKSAMQVSYAVARNVRKGEVEAKMQSQSSKDKPKSSRQNRLMEKKDEKLRSTSPVIQTKFVSSPKEFAKTSTSDPKRLNDIAQAPPEFKKLPRGAANSTGMQREGVLSMAQRSMMEQERERVILRYRQLKARKRVGKLDEN